MKNNILAKTFPTALAAGLFIMIAPQSGAQATPGIYTAGHGDIGVAFEDGELEPHWHLGSAAVVNGQELGGDGGEFAPDEIIASGSGTLVVSGANASKLNSLLGVSLNDTIYIFGSDFELPNLGWASEELDKPEWSGGVINVTLSSVSGPGYFALFQIDEADSTINTARFSSYDAGATGANNVLAVPAGGHVHYLFGFSEAGSYELSLTFSGTHTTAGFVESTATFGMVVGESANGATPVPEPATCVLLAGATGLLFALNQRMRLHLRLRRKTG
ncbi:MAG: choice-of-anchor M domain-containing protein, partial [Opitutaceae bacterium]|nr:choice-of-anchor M domain-containing protein [Opitutaceae bacterium]